MAPGRDPDGWNGDVATAFIRPADPDSFCGVHFPGAVGDKTCFGDIALGCSLSRLRSSTDGRMDDCNSSAAGRNRELSARVASDPHQDDVSVLGLQYLSWNYLDSSL